MSVRILCGDVRDRLAELPDESVHCVVTSPPYFGLRDYGMAGQIGLEDTPVAFVETMVAVFREVRRVLRNDGTLWLNMGDSYAATTKGTGGTAKSGLNAKKDSPRGTPGALLADSKVLGQHMQARRFDMNGLKPKDLIGIPWRVAFALQQPYYTGKIKDERDRIWLASMIDGEGCLFIHKRKAGNAHNSFVKTDGSTSVYMRTNDNYGAGLEIANTHESIVRRCLEITGLGSICRQDKDRKQPLFRWNLRSNECREVVREIYPHLVGKQHQARLLFGCPSNGASAEAAHTSLMALHNGRSATIDFPAPPTMFEPGWYLRQDLIWQKPNPMPESVRDRCTKAHEYLFLLSKSARYHYDQAAVMEENSSPDLTECVTPRSERAPNGEWAAGTGGRMGSVRNGRNRRSVWTVATQPFSEAHFATFPPALIEPCILAGCPKGGTVLDPFGGAGTTGLVADRHGRDAVLIELNPTYAELARKRIHGDSTLFADVIAEPRIVPKQEALFD